MRRKRLPILLSALWMSVALSGCGSAPADGENAEAGAALEEAAADTEEESEEAAEDEEEVEMITIYLPVKNTALADDDAWLSDEYEYDDHGNRTKSISYSSDGSSQAVTEVEYEYNDAGQMTKVTLYITPEDGKERCIGIEEEYEYDEDGILLKEKETRYTVYEDMPEMNNTMVTEVGYNAQGDMIKWSGRIHYEEDEDDSEDAVSENTYEYEYDAEGRVIKAIGYADAEVIYTEEYAYDANGRKIKETYDAPEYKKMVWEYEYDENGNRVKNKYDETYEDGSAGTHILTELFYEYEYDDAGKVKKWTSYDKENPEQICGECEYDADGNAIRIISYDSDGHSEGNEYEYIEMQIPDIRNYRRERPIIY